MTESFATNAARLFLETVWDGICPSDKELIAALDNLLAAYHKTLLAEHKNTNQDSLREDWKILWDRTANRFPDYGFYSVADPLDLDGASSMTIGDAIDDIADITKEMRSTIWCADNFGPDYADSYFCQFYFHWGAHARGLSGYLFACDTR